MRTCWAILLFVLCCAGCCPCSQKEEGQKEVIAPVAQPESTLAPTETKTVKSNASDPVRFISLKDLIAQGLKVDQDKNGGIKTLDFTKMSLEQGMGFAPEDQTALQSVRVVRGQGILSKDLASSFAYMPRLTELLWGDAILEENVLIPLARLNGLKKIRLTGLKSPVSEEILKTLASCPALVDLDLSGAQLTDSDIAALKDAKKLEKLTLYNTAITDQGVRNLVPLADRLIWLNLDATKITDNAGSDLAKFGTLTFLHLGRTECSDQILNSIGTLKSLKKVHITRTKITEKGAESLRKSLPNTEVISKVEETPASSN